MIDQRRIVGKKNRFAYGCDPDVMLTDRLDIEGMYTTKRGAGKHTDIFKDTAEYLCHNPKCTYS